MAKMLNMGGQESTPQVRTIPDFLQREETAAQVIALIQARFDRPGPDEMKQILLAAEQQITGLQL
jgi:hypothetical protein